MNKCILILLFLLGRNLYSQIRISDSCLPGEFTIIKDTAIKSVPTSAPLLIQNYDITEEGTEIFTGRNSVINNQVFQRDTGIINCLLIDSTILDKNNQVNKITRAFTDYKRIGNDLYFLFGGQFLGFTPFVDPITKEYISVDTFHNKSYVVKFNLITKKIEYLKYLNEYQCLKFEYFKNNCWIVAGLKWLYKYSEDFEKVIDSSLIIPKDLQEYRISYYLKPNEKSQFISIVSPDTIFISYYKILDEIDSLKKDNIRKGYIRKYSIEMRSSFDFGKSYNKVNLPINKFSYLIFENSKIGYLYGTYCYLANKDTSNYFTETNLISFIYKTTDGGLNWIKKILNKTNKININNENYFIRYDEPLFWTSLNKNLKIIYGNYSEIYLSSDNGESWKSLIDLNPSENCWKTSSIYFNFSATLNHDRIYLTSSETQFLYEYNLSNTSISEFNKFEEYNIYPNPASDYIEINLSSSPSIKMGQGGVSFEIYNIFGEIQELPRPSDTPSKEGEFLKIDISNLSSGVYFIKIGDKFEKFVKL